MLRQSTAEASNNHMQINFNGRTIELKQTIRSYMLYENVEGKPFNPKTTTDIITFFYCVIVSSSGDYSITFDDVLDLVDSRPETLSEFSQWFLSSDTNQNKLKKD